MAGKILIVEDDHAISQSLGRLLAREGYYVQARRTAEEAIDHICEDPTYDLALLDIMLPGRDGFACCREFRSLGWRGPVIILTGRSSAAYKVAGLQAGADDYVTKPFDPEELLARIQAHLRRRRDYDSLRPTNGMISLAQDLVMDVPSRQVRRGEQPIPLTEREFELLALLGQHQGKALDKLWLFQQIWGGASELGIKVLAVYVRRLRRKIEIDVDKPACLLTVRGFGYKLAAFSPD
jgi:two-component system response regulator MtrA